MSNLGLWRKKGEQFFVGDNLKVNSFGTFEFFDAKTLSPQVVFKDFNGDSLVGTVTVLDDNGRLTTSIYQDNVDLKVIQRDNLGQTITSEDVYPGTFENEEILEPFSLPISEVFILTGTVNILTVDQAGLSFNLDKTDGAVKVTVPPATEVDSGKSFFFKVKGFYYNARVEAANINNGATAIQTTKPGVSFELKSNGLTYDYIGQHSSSSNDKTLHPRAPGSFLSRGAMDGNIMAVDTSNDAFEIIVSPGICRDDTDSYDIIVTNDILLKHLNLPWASGTDAGMLDGGIELDPSTWYHIFRIKNPFTQEIDILATKFLEFPIMPDNFILKRYIGSVYTRSLAESIRPFVQREDRFMWYKPALDFEDTDVGTSGEIVTLRTPTEVKCMAYFNASSNDGAGWYFSSLDVLDEPPDSTNAPLYSHAVRVSSRTTTFQAFAETDLESQIRVRPNTQGSNLWLATTWYENRRGKDAPILGEDVGEYEFVPKADLPVATVEHVASDFVLGDYVEHTFVDVNFGSGGQLVMAFTATIEDPSFLRGYPLIWTADGVDIEIVAQNGQSNDTTIFIGVIDVGDKTSGDVVWAFNPEINVDPGNPDLTVAIETHLHVWDVSNIDFNPVDIQIDESELDFTYDIIPERGIALAVCHNDSGVTRVTGLDDDGAEIIDGSLLGNSYVGSGAFEAQQVGHPVVFTGAPPHNSYASAVGVSFSPVGIFDNIELVASQFIAGVSQTFTFDDVSFGDGGQLIIAIAGSQPFELGATIDTWTADGVQITTRSSSGGANPMLRIGTVDVGNVFSGQIVLNFLRDLTDVSVYVWNVSDINFVPVSAVASFDGLDLTLPIIPPNGAVAAVAWSLEAGITKVVGVDDHGPFGSAHAGSESFLEQKRDYPISFLRDEILDPGTEQYGALAAAFELTDPFGDEVVRANVIYLGSYAASGSTADQTISGVNFGSGGKLIISASYTTTSNKIITKFTAGGIDIDVLSVVNGSETACYMGSVDVGNLTSGSIEVDKDLTGLIIINHIIVNVWQVIDVDPIPVSAPAADGTFDLTYDSIPKNGIAIAVGFDRDANIDGANGLNADGKQFGEDFANDRATFAASRTFSEEQTDYAFSFIGAPDSGSSVCGLSFGPSEIPDETIRGNVSYLGFQAINDVFATNLTAQNVNFGTTGKIIIGVNYSASSNPNIIGFTASGIDVDIVSGINGEQVQCFLGTVDVGNVVTGDVHLIWDGPQSEMIIHVWQVDNIEFSPPSTPAVDKTFDLVYDTIPENGIAIAMCVDFLAGADGVNGLNDDGEGLFNDGVNLDGAYAASRAFDEKQTDYAFNFTGTPDPVGSAVCGASFYPAGGPIAKVNHVALAEDLGNTTQYTFSNQSFGTGGQLVVSIAHRPEDTASNNQSTLTSWTVGGVAVDIRVKNTEDDVYFLEIGTVDVGNQTSGDVVLIFSETGGQTTLNIWDVDNINPVPVFTIWADETNDLIFDTIPKNGIAIACNYDFSGLTDGITGLNDDSTNIDQGTRNYAGSMAFSEEQTNYPVSFVTASASGAELVAGVSFEPIFVVE